MVRHSGKDFINVEGISVATVLPLQSPGVQGTEFDTPEADRLTGYNNASLGEQIFDIAVTQIEAIVEPDSIGNDIRWGRLAGIGGVYRYSSTDSNVFW